MVKKILITFFVTRLLIFFGAYILANISVHISLANYILAFSKMWDSPHYLYIAKYGYTNIGDAANFIVFMPMYPLVIKIFSYLIPNLNIASLVVSNYSFLLGIIMFYKLLRLDYSKKFSYLIVVILLIFPTSYFFSSTYPESLFLFLFSTSMFYARKKRLTISILSAFLLTLTRPFGAIIWPALVFELAKNKHDYKKIFLCFGGGAAAIVCYLALNKIIYGNIFAFQEILKNHWGKSFAMPWTGILSSWKIVFNNDRWNDYKILVGLAEGIAGVLGWFFIFLTTNNKFKIHISYTVFLTISVILFTSTGFILSGPRYLLSIPPFFIILAKLIDNKFVKVYWIFFSIIATIILTALFTEGHWAF